MRSDTLRASTTYLRTNDRVRLSDLLHLLLIPSDNAAARALARLSPLGYDGFIARMNQKADDLGLEPHGLHRSVRPVCRQHLVGLRHGAADFVCVGRRSHRPDHADARILVPHDSGRPQGGARRHRPQHQSDSPQRRHGRARRQDGLHQQGRLLPGDAAEDASGGPSLAVVVLGATSNLGRFWETRHLMTWLSERTGSLSLATPAVATAK